MNKDHRFFSDRNAVSPVIGVMLMIVVTIILAAAVSSYSNSMKSQEMAPQVTLMAEASIQDGFVHLEHMGGDTIDRRNIRVEIESGYPSTSGFIDSDNVTFISNSNFLNPGDEAKVNFTHSSSNDFVTFDGEEIFQEVELGEPFRITIIDLNSGQTIYSTKITLLP
ncbi:type IV pilin N-terminal domain-containing protein [Methanolobus sp. WCC1]|uniref:type IV pilin N-terminal domain-containing protein n=1 Tax=unclassified Methanolobus TaxID=2629569 RepID=UPI002586FEFE|nr:type IV pilin N-terminal domain-containing protein [Methanolobus sp.]MDK2830429.1 archaeal type pilus assembly protein PilA [Methanolobus sp.]